MPSEHPLFSVHHRQVTKGFTVIFKEIQSLWKASIELNLSERLFYRWQASKLEDASSCCNPDDVMFNILEEAGRSRLSGVENPLCHMGTHSSTFRASMLQKRWPKCAVILMGHDSCWETTREVTQYQRIYEEIQEFRMKADIRGFRFRWCEGFTRACRNLMCAHVLVFRLISITL